MRLRRRREERGRREAAAPSSLFITAAVFLVLWVLLGGAAPTNNLVFLVLALSGSAMIAVCVMQGGVASWRSLSWAARSMMLFFCLMPVLQLIPLPPAVWQSLPGRGLPTDVLAAVGVANEWRPLTLSVNPTFRTALIFFWLASFMLSLLQLSLQQWHRMFGILVALGLLNVAIGIVQVISGDPSLQLYDNAFVPYMNGLFANKNHTGLFIDLTFLAGYFWVFRDPREGRRRLGLVLPIAAILFVALLVTFSRAAVVLGVVAIGLIGVLASGGRLTGRARLIAVLAVPATAIVLVGIGSTDLVDRSLLRFGGVGGDERWLFARWSWPLVGAYFPFGTGIGAFTAVFPPHEQLAWVKPTYVNHVHDDYLEQLIEVGVAAPIAWLLGLAAIVGPVRAAWADRTSTAGRLALIGAGMLFLIAAHSTVDYPLRRPGIAVTFMVALAAVLRISGFAERNGRPGVWIARGIDSPTIAELR